VSRGELRDAEPPARRPYRCCQDINEVRGSCLPSS
jgi:hypothetical protein